MLLLLIAVLGVRERSSVERGNRLHRGGEWSPAAEIFSARLESASAALETPADLARQPASEPLHYNLGTTLLASGDGSAAEARLARAIAGEDDALDARAFYNMGVGRLRRATEAMTIDSAFAHAAVAVEVSRSALRLRPGEEDAAWNLALAQRILDSLSVDVTRSGLQASGALPDAEIVQSETSGEAAAEEVQAPPSSAGEDETAADTDASARLSLAEAAEILARVRLDGELITGKLLGLEGRSRLGRTMRSTRRRW